MIKHRKKQWNMMKTRENTNETWWKREEKQWKMMTNRNKTMKTDEK